MFFGQGQIHRRCDPVCGLYYNVHHAGGLRQAYLPQVEVKVHASILATTSRTVLKQTFVNPSTTRGIREVRYAFPLYDGVSVVGYSCRVGNRMIVGEVKEKDKAKEVFRNAAAQGETAGLLEQLPEASDVFITTISNIPPGAKVVIDITYLGELKHDMEVDGIRFTIPASICPRYGGISGVQFDTLQQMDATISITVDAEMAEGSFIRKLQSPTHPIAMSIGTTSLDPDAAPSMNKASATLSLGNTHLETDFVLQVITTDVGTPKALLETHHTIPNHRALMATLVPRFSLPPEKPEIVIVCDRSGSMTGGPMKLMIEALQVFLKSLPVGVKFNICSFGSRHSFLWPRSLTYSQDTLDQAVRHAAGFQANYGGTDILCPLKETIDNRYNDMPLDVILLTDGKVWHQNLVFNYLNEQVQAHKETIRVFTLGIGSGASHALIEGIAKAGNGFAQSVSEGEIMGSKVIRMLKGALSPHVNDYTLEVKYEAAEEEDGFDIVEKVADNLTVKLDLDEQSVSKAEKAKKPISLFDTSEDLKESTPPTKDDTGEDRYAHLSPIPTPRILQVPQNIPSLFAFNRTTVYLLLGPDAPHARPTSVILRGTSIHGPLELEIPVQILHTPGETVHQLAAKKAVSELEQGRGWLASARSADGQLLKTRFDGRFSDMVEREAVRLGVQFQVGGKWCSFVATEKVFMRNSDDEKTVEEWEYLEDEQPAAPVAAFSSTSTNFARRLQPQQQGRKRSLSKSARSIIPSQSKSAVERNGDMLQSRSRGGPRSGGEKRQSGSLGLNMPIQMQMQQQQQCSISQNSNSSPLSEDHVSLATSQSGALQGHQSRLMLLQQQNKRRLLMARQDQCSDVEGRAYRSSIPPSSPPDSFAPSSFPNLNSNSPPSPQELLHHLIHWQTFNGSFPYDPSIITLLGVSLEAFESTLQTIGQVGEDLLITALVIVYMKNRLEDFKGEWELVVEKAEAWVEERLSGLYVDVHAFLKAAEDLIVV